MAGRAMMIFSLAFVTSIVVQSPDDVVLPQAINTAAFT
jgi:hypothetical protein